MPRNSPAPPIDYFALQALVQALGNPASPDSFFSSRAARTQLNALSRLGDPDKQRNVLLQGAMLYPQKAAEFQLTPSETGGTSEAAQNLGLLISGASGVNQPSGLPGGPMLWNEIMNRSLLKYLAMSKGLEI